VMVNSIGAIFKSHFFSAWVHTHALVVTPHMNTLIHECVNVGTVTFVWSVCSSWTSKAALRTEACICLLICNMHRWPWTLSG
jgi:hypothetical protein